VSVREIDIGADSLISALLKLSETEQVCVLDSCGVGHLGSHLLIAGISPVESFEISGDADESLAFLDRKLSQDGLATFFTLSYDLGRKLQDFPVTAKTNEPDMFAAMFDCVVVHDYDSRKTFLTGNAARFDQIENQWIEAKFEVVSVTNDAGIASNFSREEYIAAIETIKEYIRDGDTYQTNLTQRFTVSLPDDLRAAEIFWRLRHDHPAPFSAFFRRTDSTVVSASPERFFRLSDGNVISTSPIKGTRPRGETPEKDAVLRRDLLSSEKDRAENTMIVDLLRNDLGRVCEYGSVRVEKLCDIEEHPTLFHLVSTTSGKLRNDVKPSDILKALFPCGSITGAPKIRTMQIIDEIETVSRGLSMGAIGYSIPHNGFDGLEPGIDTSVSIRTMTIKDQTAVFNVGGGIVIDSDPQSEYDESLLKAKALLNALK
jgi:para-aminobenzoate synthetase component 1